MSLMWRGTGKEAVDNGHSLDCATRAADIRELLLLATYK